MTAELSTVNNDLVILHREAHGHLKLNRAAPDFGFARDSVTVALTVAELPAACAEYPCVMARQPDGALSLLAVTGLQAGHNLFVAADGAWQGQYLPATLATWPFRLVRESDDGRFLVAVRPEALNPSVGDPLFNAEGQELPWLLERLRQLTETDAGMGATTAQLAQLDAAGVLVDRSLQVILPDGREVDAERLLGEEVFAGGEDVAIQLLMQVVRDGHVDHVDVRVGEERLIVGGLLRAGGDAVEPRERGGIEVGHGREDRADRDVGERAPAGERAGHFATHEAAADDADVYGRHEEKLMG